MLSAIPYHTFPDLFSIGSLQLRTFGLMVGLGVLIGAWVAAVQCQQFGIEREATYSLATRLVVFGVIGARLTWDISHWEEINSPIDLIAVWNGGLQFSGGFILAVLVAIPVFRKWDRLTKWRVIDGFGLGLTIGLAFGRIGCTSVGEHFGSTWGSSWFPLMVRYTRDPAPGELREPFLGTTPVVKDIVFHNTAIYELLWLLGLFAAMWVVLHRKPRVTPGTGIAMFCAVYSVFRFSSDFLRINDKLVLGLTGAQYTMILVFGAAIWLIFGVLPKNRVLQAAELEAEASAPAVDGTDSDATTNAAEPDEATAVAPETADAEVDLTSDETAQSDPADSETQDH